MKQYLCWIFLSILTITYSFLFNSERVINNQLRDENLMLRLEKQPVINAITMDKTCFDQLKNADMIHIKILK